MKKKPLQRTLSVKFWHRLIFLFNPVDCIVNQGKTLPASFS